MQNPLKSQFMQESYGSWFIFLGVMLLFLAVWSGVLRYIRK